MWYIWADRGQFPNHVKTPKLQPGQSIHLKNGNIIAVFWKDKRDVFLASSIHGNSESNIERFLGNITKHGVISDNNKNMGGVDKCDHFLSYYAVGRKTMNWWKKVFFRMFELSIINTMCIYFEKHSNLLREKTATNSLRHFGTPAGAAIS